MTIQQLKKIKTGMYYELMLHYDKYPNRYAYTRERELSDQLDALDLIETFECVMQIRSTRNLNDCKDIIPKIKSHHEKYLGYLQDYAHMLYKHRNEDLDVVEKMYLAMAVLKEKSESKDYANIFEAAKRG